MRKGLSLIEVLIACVVLAIVVVGFILAVLSVQRAAEEARIQAIVAAFCNYKFADLETRGVSYIYQTYGEPKQEPVTDGFGHTLLPDTVTVRVVGDDTNGDGKPDKYYGSSDLVCVQIVYRGKVMGERVFGDTDPYIADDATPPDIFYADFTADPTSGLPPLTVQFKDLSSSTTSTIVSWSWDFGDGGTSDERNPSHTYSSEGKYTVTLTVMDNSGRTRTCTKTDYIVVGGVKAQFTATPTYGDCPLTVTFTDNSVGVITNWRWDFGDGTVLEMDSSNYQPSVTHVYNTPGEYTVTLRVQQIEDGKVKDEDTASATIEVKAVLTVRAESSDGANAGEPNPGYGSNSYDAGTVVNATCGPNPYSPEDGKRYVCLGWRLEPGRNGEPSEEGSGTSVSITMDRNYTLTWKWQLQYELTVTVDDPLGNGSVMKTPDSADGWYNAGTEVTLLATPSEEFRQWTGDASGAEPQISVTMNSAKDITAIFNKFKLTVTTVPSDINPAVLDPGRGDNWLQGGSTTCKASLHVDISEGARYRLVSYAGTGAVPSGAVPFSATTDPYEVTFSLNQDSSIEWRWERFYRVRAVASPSAGGSITWSIPAGTEYYTDNGEHWFKEGSSGVSLTAVPSARYHFVGWQEDGVTISTDATLDLPNINSARNLVAVFAKDQYTLYVRCKVDGYEVGPPSEGIDSPNPPYGDHLYDDGTTVNATIDSGTVTKDGTRWIFQGWEVKIGDSVTTGSTDSVDITMTANTFLYWRWKTQYCLQLTVTKGGTVDVTVNGSTNNYTEGTYDLWFDRDTEVTLKAISGSGPFICWQGDYPDGERTSSEITITMDEAKTLKAVFGVFRWWNWYASVDGTNKLASLHNTEVTTDRWGNTCLQLARQIIGDWDSQAQCTFGETFNRMVLFDDPVAQTFVPSRNGYLDKVQLYVGPDWWWVDSGFYWMYGIVEIHEGGPDGRKLAESGQVCFYCRDPHWQTFNIKNPPYVRAGQTYTIVCRAGRTRWWDGAWVYWSFEVYGEEGDHYKDGAAYYRWAPWWPWQRDKNGRDYYFRVHIGGQWDPNAALGRMVEDWRSWVGGEDEYLAQTFTPSKSGKITKVKAYMRGGGFEGPPDAYVEIREGGPRGRVLGRSEIVSTPWDADWVEFPFQFSSAPSVEAGKTYAMVFRFHWSGPYEEPPPETAFTVYGRQYNPYKGGAGYYGWGGNWWRFPDDRDLMFQVFIESEDSRKYYPYGYAVTVEVPETDTVVAWDRIIVLSLLWWENISLTIKVLDADTGEVLKDYLLPGWFMNVIDISDIDAGEHPRIKLKAEFTSDGDETPELFWLRVLYYAEP